MSVNNFHSLCAGTQLQSMPVHAEVCLYSLSHLEFKVHRIPLAFMFQTSLCILGMAGALLGFNFTEQCTFLANYAREGSKEGSTPQTEAVLTWYTKILHVLDAALDLSHCSIWLSNWSTSIPVGLGSKISEGTGHWSEAISSHILFAGRDSSPVDCLADGSQRSGASDAAPGSGARRRTGCE